MMTDSKKSDGRRSRPVFALPATTRRVLGTLVTMIVASVTNIPQLSAAQQLTTEQIREVMDAADIASVQRDTTGIGVCLSEGFFKYIDVPSETRPVTARIDKQQYLTLIEEGWNRIQDYAYRRKDVVINVAPDGSSGESYSTVIESFTVDGKPMVSKVREHALYELEDERPVIVTVDSHTLVGDTTPE